MKSRIILVAAAIALAAVSWLMVAPPSPRAPEPAVSGRSSDAATNPKVQSVQRGVYVGATPAVASAPAPAPPPAVAVATPALETTPAKTSDAPTTADVPIETALEEVQTMLRDYRSAVGENPVGTNAEIMRAINGDNLKQANIGPPSGQRLNEHGELVDPWGTPYFFHQVSGNRMEIRSAGPDRVMWTADDCQM